MVAARVKEPSLEFDLRVERPGQAKHERLKDHLVKEMLAGRLAPGQALPSENHLVKTLGVARTTVRQAMASLENDGLIRRVQGKGTYVDSDARRKLKRGLDIFALVVPETRAGFYPSLLHGFEVAASDIHHQTIICSTDNNVERQANIVLQLLDKDVGGVAIVPTSEPPTPAFQIRQIQNRGVPVLFCHRRVEEVSAPLLALPFREVGSLAAKALAERGHRRVAFFTHQRTQWTKVYEEGLREGLQASDGDVHVETVVIGESIVLQEESLFAALQRTFARPDPPTAIFTSFDSVSEMIYLLLPRLGLRVPEDVSLVGEGGAYRQGAIIRRLTSVVIDEVATGRKAVELLHEMRCGERAIDDDEEFVLRLDLYEGETLAAPAVKKQGVA
jgi:GntR family transcriptional regulator, arabinose operon transcriptional repressor